ncbi:hypothetical protein LCI18_012427 [Fusarium solani-melongenae]|uniref:Uncharacterized protein n=1 Tax=Fusarium solani subsp. cucurbitae TaxID=2747967 RepID=A0ACD3ZJT4_FUSSC|nr:hypothetical protein LCI18_012427 [Fusarium solani-melongenae]
MSTTQNAGLSWLAPYEVCKGVDIVERRQAKLERHEILHYLHGSQEEHHCSQLETFQIHYPHILKRYVTSRRGHGAELLEQTVPIFLLKGHTGSAGLPEIPRPALHNHLYRRWSRPYRTDMEYGQFIAHILHFRDQPAAQDEDPAVGMTMSMHGTVCSNFDSKIPATQPEKQQYYTTRPLFRAMAIVIQGKYYSRCYDIRPLFYMPVLIILTGQDDGLSAPITFGSITDAEIVTICDKVAARANLETAIGFVMALEEREDAAFGPQPDPVASTANSCYLFRENRAE